MVRQKVNIKQKYVMNFVKRNREDSRKTEECVATRISLHNTCGIQHRDLLYHSTRLIKIKSFLTLKKN